MLQSISRFCLLPAVLLLSCSSRADTFTVWNFDTDNGSLLLGIDAAGEVLYDHPEADFGDNYAIFDRGKIVYFSAKTFPSFFVFDNGTPCAAPSVPAGDFSGGPSVCNGDRQVYGLGTPVGPFLTPREIYPGSSPLGDAAASLGAPGSVVLNASGDFAYVDSHNLTLRQVIVSQVPEPSSLLLLGTGMSGLFWTMRRRVVGH